MSVSKRRASEISATALVKQEDADLYFSNYPHKRRRLIPEVVLPTLKSVYSTQPHKKIAKSEELGTIPKYKKESDVKPKFELDNDSVRRRIGDSKPFEVTLDPRIRDVEGPNRAFFSNAFGGIRLRRNPCISPKSRAKLVHEWHDLTYPSLTYDPYLPQTPGAPGLKLFASKDQRPRDWGKTQKLITHTFDGRRWYLGEYNMVETNPLTREEWGQLHNKVKYKWCVEIQDRKWGRFVRARIMLRKTNGREPSVNEIHRAIKIRTHKFEIKADEIRAAYNEGKEAMAVYRLVCESYDEAFQRDVVMRLDSGKYN